ncbi:MAG: PEP-CTERM sorting domain-containing protein [Acidobacteriota bacterium]
MKASIVPGLMMAVALMAVPSAAATLFTVSANGGSLCAGGSGQSTSSAPLQVADTWGCVSGASSSEAVAAPEGIGIGSSTYHYCCGSASESNALAQFATEFTVKGPAGPAIAISMNFLLEGAAIATVDASWGLTIDTGIFGTGYIDSSGRNEGLLTGFVAVDGGIAIGGAFTTPSILLAPNTTQPFRLTLSGGTGANGSGNANLDFVDTMSLPTTGPVFNLPSGYTVDIPDLYVFDNRFLPPGTGGAVPEPSSLAMMGGGLALLAIARRRGR